MSLTGMNIEEVEQRLAELKSGADSLYALTLQVNNLQGPLTDAWEGVEATACVEYLNKLSTKMKDMSEYGSGGGYQMRADSNVKFKNVTIIGD